MAVLDNQTIIPEYLLDHARLQAEVLDEQDGPRRPHDALTCAQCTGRGHFIDNLNRTAAQICITRCFDCAGRGWVYGFGGSYV